jgi:hypothetical protein
MKNQVPQEFINELAGLFEQDIFINWVGTGNYNSAKESRETAVNKIIEMSKKYNFNPDVLIDNI